MLVHSIGGDSANNWPLLSAAATSHADNVATAAPQRRATAAAAANTAATASANAEPAGTNPAGSASRSRTSPVNTRRNTSAREANRRSQPRTVAAGRANTPAMRRAPHPAARAANPAPITAAVSARRANASTGSNTCVRPHPAHTPRRGRTRTRPSADRNHRTRANPHGRNIAEQSGHATPPARSRDSTPPGPASTVSIGASEHHPRPSRTLGQEKTGRAVANTYLLTVSPHTKKGQPARAAQDPAHSKRRRPTPRPHTERRSTLGERRGDAQRWWGVESEFVVAAAQILHEGVPGDDHLRGPIGLQSAHRSAAGA